MIILTSCISILKKNHGNKVKVFGATFSTSKVLERGKVPIEVKNPAVLEENGTTLLLGQCILACDLQPLKIHGKPGRHHKRINVLLHLLC